MKNYISEGRAVYEDYNHGQFSKKLAQWAIGNMQVKDAATGKIVPLKATPLDEAMETMKSNGVKVEDKQTYTAWYLYNMTRADYPKALPTDTARCAFVAETINDPDACPEAVLECFIAKMCCVGMPIFWEEYL